MGGSAVNTDSPSEVIEKKRHPAEKGALSKIVKGLSKVVDPTSRALGTVAGAALASMMLLTFCDVILRYLFNRPILGSMELTEFMMVILVTFGLAYCAFHKGHIRVDIVLMHTSRRANRVLDIITYGLATIFFIFVTWQSFLNAKTVMADKLLSIGLYIPIFIFVFVLAIGMVLLILVFMRDTLASIREVTKK